MTPSKADPTGSGVESTSVDLETALGLLTDDHRRQVLLTLRERQRRLSIDELARAVAAREQESTPDGDRQSLAARVRVSLYHNHLPKLHDADVVEYDADRGTVALAMEPTRLERLLDAVRFVQQ